MKSGDSLQGYELIEPIAQGGMGTVWKAKHPNLERVVAIKCIRADLLLEPKARRLFVEEVKLLSQLHSPQVLQVLDSGVSEQDEPFMVTEFLNGEDLSQHLDAHGAVDAAEACRIGIDVLRALTEAHALGIIHGDLKPSNVFLMSVPGEQKPVVKVLDFGVASLMEENHDDTETLGGREVRGSLQYMAPEQLTQGKITAAADLYTFGAMMYRLLTNRHVFSGDSEEQIRLKLTEEPEAPSIASTINVIPESLDLLVLSCLERRPEDRPSSASALRRRLELVMSKLDENVERTKTTTALDASVPDWLQSGFSQDTSETSADDIAAIASRSTLESARPLELEGESLAKTSMITDTENSGPLLENVFLEGGASKPTIELDVSRTVEQAAPSISRPTDSYGSTTLVDNEQPPSVSEPSRSSGREGAGLTQFVVVFFLIALLGIAGYLLIPTLLGEFSDGDAQSEASMLVKPRKSAAQELAEGKALLESFRKDRPEPTAREKAVKKEETTSIFLILPKGQKAKFINAKTRARLCPGYVQSCRVPRNIDVLLSAPSFKTKRLASTKLREHSEPSMKLELSRQSIRKKK